MFRGVTLPPEPFTIVLDFCNGGSLYSKLTGSDEISAEKELEWALDIAAGMVSMSFLQFTHSSFPDSSPLWNRRTRDYSQRSW